MYSETDADKIALLKDVANVLSELKGTVVEFNGVPVDNIIKDVNVPLPEHVKYKSNNFLTFENKNKISEYSR